MQYEKALFDDKINVIDYKQCDMNLHSPESAILSAVIFNAIIIPILIPLALRGVQYKPIGASALLRRNLLIYGVGGVIVPFVGIKLIDLLVGLFF